MTKADKDARIIKGHLDSIHAQTGKTVDDFRALAAELQLTKHAELMAWLNGEHKLEQGHASAVIHLPRDRERGPATRQKRATLSP